ncbi:MAG TPA: response regulator [Thermoanaerobaculia bacterium]|nr:response regulator [Thermoanaerobaculia bacterium]
MGSRGRVLVVDDERAIRALVAKIVERMGHPVDTACDGADAIAKLEVERYDVIVLDLMMPNIDGYGLIAHLKQRGGPRPAIIVVSAGESVALRQLDPAMVHSIIRKPFDIDVLGDLISAAAQAAELEQKAHHDVLPFRRNDHAC